jgi:hypothetical protein
MGEISCGAWPKNTAHTNLEKAVTLNWVLGFLSRAGWQDGRDLLAQVDQASIAAWMDNYCAAHPLDTVIQGSWVLERELTARTTPDVPNKSTAR